MAIRLGVKAVVIQLSNTLIRRNNRKMYIFTPKVRKFVC